MSAEARTRPKASDRAEKIRGRLIEGPPRVDVERLKFLMEVWRETGADPVIIRRAKHFDKMCREQTIFIDESLLAGSHTRFPTGGVRPIVEIACNWLKKEEEFFCHLGKLEYDEEDRKVMLEAVDYWKDKCVHARAKEIFQETYPDLPSSSEFAKSGVWTHIIASLPQLGVTPNWGSLLRKGLKGVKAEMKEESDKVSMGSLEGLKKKEFYKAAIISLDALVALSHRYAALARAMAEKEGDPKRKKELGRLAEVCEWVPENSPRSFYEAMQFVWMVNYASGMEQYSSSAHTPSRWPMYVSPYYLRDKEEGKITPEEAAEIIECYLIKHLEGGLFVAKTQYRINSGQTGQQITIGGLNEQGDDATTELDYLILDAQEKLQIVQPTLSLLYHDKLSEDFLLKAAEVVRETGLGQPAFFNNEIAMQRHLFHYPGISMSEAWVVGHSGCIQTLIPGRTAGVWEGNFYMPKMLEIVLHNGKDPLGGLQVGLKTGELEDFDTYEKLHDAIRKQLEYHIKLVREFDQLALALEAEIYPVPFQSACMDDCIKSGLSIQDGGLTYSCLGTWAIGTVDLGNSLAAIKKLVYEEKKITLRQLKEALDADFEGDGYDKILRMCLVAPKYGNDDPYADSIVREWFDIYYEEHQKIPNYLGRTPIPHAISLSSHYNGGRLCGALPSGRKAGIPFTDGTVSAFPGTDTHGPTALVHSAARAVPTIKYGDNHFNMKFHPSALEGREGLKKLLALTKTYMDLGGSHVQFNCISGDTLKEAKLHPEGYRDLVVRVAGFSAFFVHLDEGIQDEIIRRTELHF